MKEKTTTNFMVSSVFANLICATVYITLGFLCISMFGDTIMSDVLLNMASRPGLASIVLRLVFAFLLITHIPYIFFSTKEATLVIIDEATKGTISDHLEDKIKVFKNSTQDR
jgi:hypothetical protein